MNINFRGLRLAFAILLLTSFLPAFAADKLPAQTVAQEVRCPVCGMYPARYPKWMTQVVFKDRSMQAFDSPVDMFRFLENVSKYDGKHVAADVGAIYLTDYAKGGWVESRRAFLVTGSSAKGPMDNADLPAFGSKEAADQFATSNGGKVLTFDKVKAETLNEPGSSPDHDHSHHGH